MAESYEYLARILYPTSLNKERSGRREAILLVSGVLLLVLAAASICMGAVPVTLRELAEALTTGETATSAGRIIWFVRMPRTWLPSWPDRRWQCPALCSRPC